jgi:hypothetical protein
LASGQIGDVSIEEANKKILAPAKDPLCIKKWAGRIYISDLNASQSSSHLQDALIVICKEHLLLIRLL